MPDANPPDTWDTNSSDVRLNRFEAVWLAWRASESVPRWQEHLPADDEPCIPDRIFYLLQIDIEFRVKAGMPALLAERYFEHPRLQREDARLDAEREVELIRWEYQQRWEQRDPARRAEYEAAFPRQAEALRDLKPSWRCPQCRKAVVLEETAQTFRCPDCGEIVPRDGHVSPCVPETPTAADRPLQFDSRVYELVEQLGKGGMGEVYRASDPALGRDLAIKVVKTSYRGNTEAERRFLREARVTGSLQHPNIVPVHNLGRLADGRLHYTMRLVRGQTFADILKDEAGKPERLPYLLTIFEKICQAVAYAHSKRVIHRDLKPHNVMVGRFGEVQVMDWGLAKLLTANEDTASPQEPSDDGGTRIHTESADTPVDLSRTGSGMGTPAYMPSEQARGKWDRVDERADVFALGSILCEMLTGQPAYIGTNFNEVFDRAERGDVAEALQRLQQCSADAALTALCRECLAPEREDRPRGADVVAKRVAAYQAEVQERLRQAELERVAAETRAREEQARAIVEQERTREALARVKAERRAKRRTLALAAAVMVLIAGGGGGLWWRHFKQAQADREALVGLERGRERLEEGWRTNDVPKLTEAIAEAERAVAIVRNGGASDAVEQRVAAFRAEAQGRLGRATENEKLLSALVDVSTPHETKIYQKSGAGEMVMALAGPSVEEQYAAAFHRRWPDVDVDKQGASEVAARLQEEPEKAVQGVIAGLDAWMVDRRRQQRPEAEWRRLLAVVEQLDQSEPRRQLRVLLIGATPPSAASVTGLFAGRPPWPALWELVRGNDWRRLRQIRGQMNPADEPVLTVLLLAQANNAVGDMSGAEEALRLALARRPDEVALLDTLGKVLERQGRLADAIGCYRAARAKHPGLGVSLYWALGKTGQWVEGEAVLRELIRQQPKNPEMYFSLGNALGRQGKVVEAEAACRKAIALKPDLALAYLILGAALGRQGKFGEAETVCRKAIALKPDYAEAYSNLGAILDDQGKPAEAEVACRKAIAVKPDLAEAYYNLGNALLHQGKPAEAEVACRKAIAVKPDLAEAYYNLGNALLHQGKPAEAETAYRKAIALKPDFAEAHNNLSAALNGQGKPAEAEVACRKAIALKPDFALAYCNLGVAIGRQKKHVLAEAIFRKAIALKPDLAEAYNGLGVALKDQGKPGEAEAAYRKALALKPDYAGAHCNRGYVLGVQGRFTESLAAYRRGHELGSKQPGWRYPSLQWLRAAERLVELKNKLPGILQSKALPANPSETVSFAQMCQQYKKLHVAAARLYADAFAADPKLAADLNQHRYNATRSAALAAAGQGEDARLLPDKAVVMFRRWALGWLRDDLTAYAKIVERNNPAAIKAIQQRLTHWRSDPDLASVRDQPALDRLPDNERAAWQSLWRDVDALVKRVAK